MTFDPSLQFLRWRKLYYKVKSGRCPVEESKLLDIVDTFTPEAGVSPLKGLRYCLGQG